MTDVRRLAADMASLGPAVVAIGAFDGVHVGHQALVRDSIALARAAGVASLVMTFEPDPEDVLFPDSAPPRLTLEAEKTALLSALEPDSVLVVAFDEHLASLSPRAFTTDLLGSVCVLHTVVVGSDFRFGAHAAGTVDTLRELGQERGFGVVGHELIAREGATVTSTRIRGLVADGDVAHAATLLGRPHRVVGAVVRGRGLGRDLGFPTANIRPASHVAMPAPGVYACRAIVQGAEYPAAVSLGAPPTFPDAPESLEAHLVGFQGDLYGASVSVDFLDRIRGLTRHASPAALAAAIAADVREVIRVAGA